jgi:hypothetical protein
MATTTFNDLITFSRGSNATVTGPNGLIQWAPNNLVTNSQDFEAAAWVKTNATIYPNQDFGNGTLGPELVSNPTPNFRVLRDGVNPITSYSTGAILTTGKWYLVSFSITNNVGNQPANFFIGSVNVSAGRVDAGFNGTKTLYVLHTSGTLECALSPAAATVDFVVSAFSVKEVTPAAATAPDGTLTADALIEAFDVGQLHSTNVSTANSLLGVNTFSIYLKASGRNWALLNFAVANGVYSSSDARAWFDLANGVVGTVGGSGAAAQITSVGNGWYRCTLVSTNYPTSGNRKVLIATATADGSTSNDGDGTSGLLIWGAQLELGSTATTYNNTSVRNLLGFSEAFDNAAWSKTGASIVTSAQANPINSLFNAQKLMEDTASGTHRASQIVNTVAAPYTFSVYVKAAERAFVLLYHNQSNAGQVINLTTGALAGNAGLSAPVSSSVTNIGSGWYRVSMTVTATAAGNTFNVYPMANSTSYNYTGDGNSGVYIYGAMLSNSASLDPYVPTPGAAPSSTAYYGPRFDYDPVTLLPRGLLIEEARTNLATYSDQFDNAAWTKSNTTVTANASTSPDGTTNADKLAETSAVGFHLIQQTSSSVAATTPITWAVYVKAAERTWIYAQMDAGGGMAGDRFAYFNLASGVVGTTQANTTATITPAGNGWYRCAITATSDADGGAITAKLITAFDGSTLSYAGVAGSGIFLYGAQLEAGAFATSYIPTIASTVTRSADVATITGSLFSQWYNQSAGSFIVVADSPGVSGAANITTVDDGTLNERIRILTDVLDPKVIVTDGGVTQANIDAGAITALQPFNMSAAYALNDIAACLNGGSVGTDTSATLPTVTILRAGADSAGNYLNGHIRSIRYVPVRAADFQLQALTELPLVPTLDADFINNLYEA